MPSFGDAFTLAELPRLADLPFPARVAVPELQQLSTRKSADDFIHLGISKLIISSYVMNPSPKLVWSFPLSPNTIVRSLDKRGDLYAVGVRGTRKKNRLVLIRRENGDESTNTHTDLQGGIQGVFFGGGDDNVVHVLLTKGRVVVVTYDDTEELRITSVEQKLRGVPTLPDNDSNTVIYYRVIHEHEFHHTSPLLFYVVHNHKTGKLTARLVGLDGIKSFEMYALDIPGKNDKNGNNLAFAYNNGVVYRFDSRSNIITKSPLSNPSSVISTVSLGNLFTTTTKGKCNVTIAAPAPDRVLFSIDDHLYMVNLQYKALLDEFTPTPAGPAHLVFCAESYALYLAHDPRSNTTALHHVLMSLGTSTLLECLGKALPGKTNATPWSGMPAIGSDIAKEEAAESNLLKNTYNFLRLHITSINAFDRHLVDFLTLQRVIDIEDAAFSSESDRVVDDSFITSVVELIFTIDESGSVALRSESVPRSLGYLLSHPLYPARYARGLLLLLSELNEPALLKRALEECSAVSPQELVAELVNLAELADETNKDKYVMLFLHVTVARLVRDYPVAEITSQLRTYFARDLSPDTGRLDRMLGALTLLNSPQAWDLVQAVVDVGGFFNWSIDAIDNLDHVIADKMDALSANIYNLTLTNQTLRGVSGKRKSARRDHRRTVDGIVELGTQKEELDALLTMNDVTPKRPAIDGIEMANMIPAYSQEKLLL